MISIVEISRKKEDLNMAGAAGYKLKAHLKIESSLASIDFLKSVVKR